MELELFGAVCPTGLKQWYFNCTGVSELLCDITGHVIGCEDNVCT